MNSYLNYGPHFFSIDPEIQPAIDSGIVAANETIAAGDAILESTSALTERLDEEEQSIVFIQDNVRNATTLITGLPNRGKRKNMYRKC